MMNFWDNLEQPFTILAPMEDVTDIVFRQVIKKAGRPTVFMTEFTNAASFCSNKGNFSTKGRLTFDSKEQPIVAQIWGTNPDNFAYMSKDLARQGFSGIDINMGCPAKDVVKTGAGSALIKNPQLAIQLIKASRTGGLPVSVKTRLGFNNLIERTSWLTSLLEQQLANLTVHLRTRKEMSKVSAHYDLIDELISLRNQIAPNTKLTINGDIKDLVHIKELHHSYPDINGFMIGRGVFNNPFCFTDKQDIKQPELTNLFLYHLDLYDKYKQIMPQERPDLIRNFDSLKHFFKIYVKGIDGAADIRAELYSAKTTDQVRQIIKQRLINIQ